jgi:hypothetical protein
MNEKGQENLLDGVLVNSFVDEDVEDVLTLVSLKLDNCEQKSCEPCAHSWTRITFRILAVATQAGKEKAKEGERTLAHLLVLDDGTVASKLLCDKEG